VLGDSPWTSIAGSPLPEAPCAPNGNGNAGGYQLVSPNWRSNWVRGFSWYHNGVDIAANYGNPIRAAQAGEVIWAGWDFYGLGYSIKINHCNNVSTVYGHMSQLLAKAGDHVQPGQVIGLEGSTGFSTGPHLHFMVEWNNVPVDPMPYYGYAICRVTGRC
jgi:murein DD-endopeptidase MepM/ murein hydrolase activator NlpD